MILGMLICHSHAVSFDLSFSRKAAYTTVLLLGATGRVGRVMLRKLLLRGYTVKVLSRDESSEFPKSVIVVNGDVGDYQQVREVVKGVDKVYRVLQWFYFFGCNVVLHQDSTMFPELCFNML